MALARFRTLLREMFGIVPTLDLHGLGVRDAVAETERFIREASVHKVRTVRIVYGKGNRSPGGRGVLRDVIPHWLEHEGRDLVERYERRPDGSGADGAVQVWPKCIERF